MNKAFTMIELIFVIVILGILAAVAIPKLSATRDDATITKLMDSVSVAVNEIVGYAMSTGMVKDDLTLMSGSLEKLKKSNLATLGVRKADIKAGQVSDCLTIEILSSGNDENVSLSFGTPGTDVICKELQTKMVNSVYTVPIRGEVAEF